MPENKLEEKFDIKETDEELLQTISGWITESTSFHDEMLRDQKIAEQYYLGNQTERDFIPPRKSNIVENRIFEGIETITPIATANVHVFRVLPGSETEESLQKANVLGKVLDHKYEKRDIKEKMEDIVRHIYLYKFGVLEYYWDKEIDDINARVLDPRMILIPKLRVNPHRLPYTIKILKFTRSELEVEFPKLEKSKIEEIKTTIDQDTGESGEEQKKTFKVYEIWTDEMVLWTDANKDIVINKIPNPYYDFAGEKKATFEEKEGKDGKIKKVKTEELIFRNHFDRPEKPFIFFVTFNISDGPVPKKGVVDIAIPIQDGINTQKRRIIDNVNFMGNGQVYIDSEVISEEEADNLTNSPGLVIRGPGIASENRIRRDPGVPLPAGHFNNLQHSEIIFDNIFGVHGPTRGTAGGDTLGQDIISRQQDFSRIDMITRVLNRGVNRLANGWVQLMRMFYTETQIIKIIGEEDTVEFLRLTQDDIEDFIEVVVKSSEEMPMDRNSLRNEAVQLWQLGAIDPVTLFERLGFPNPEKAAERLQAWKLGQLTQETQFKIAEINAGQQARGNKESSKPEENRGTETSNNVVDRANKEVSGGAKIDKGQDKRTK